MTDLNNSTVEIPETGRFRWLTLVPGRLDEVGESSSSIHPFIHSDVEFFFQSESKVGPGGGNFPHILDELFTFFKLKMITNFFCCI